MASNDDGNNETNELTNYIHNESSRNDRSSASEEILPRHALEQLVLSRLGADMTAAVQRLTTEDDVGWWNAVHELVESPSFRLM